MAPGRRGGRQPGRAKEKDHAFDSSFASRSIPGVSLTVCACVENRSRETSIVKLDTANATVLEVIVVQDTQSYASTIDALGQLEPDEILLHDGARGRVLSTKIVEAFHREGEGRVLFVSRQYFDQDKGAELLRRLTPGGAIDGELLAKYTAIAAAHCLIRYVENVSAISFANGTLRIRFDMGDRGRMTIDRATAAELEILANARSGSHKHSLFGVINRTKTAVGARLLRSNLLSPSADAATIQERLRLVEFFLTHEGTFTATLHLLAETVDLDRVLTGISTVPKMLTEQTAGKGIGTLIALRHTLQMVPSLVATLEEGIADAQLRASTPLPGESEVGRSHRAERVAEQGQLLLAAVVENLKHEGVAKILAQIDSLLNESTEYQRNPHQMRHQECFAVKPDVDGMLDVARKTFLQSVEDIYGLVEGYSARFDVDCKVNFSGGRGYHVVLSAAVVREKGLPDCFIQAVENLKTVTTTTEEVASLSDRAREALHEALLRTHELIQGLMAALRTNLDVLFAATEAIALLDMLFGFADLVTVAPPDLPWSRPTITREGPLAIKDGRHPVMAVVQSDRAFTPNDVYISPFINFIVITGSNGAGKSTLLKQVALTVILAQCGCYVPASEAVIPVRNRLLTRIGTGDDMENNLSTFLMEMRSAAQILRQMGPRSLILIDELGRGTSTREGLGIAWAVAERVLASGAFTFFATHSQELTRLEAMHENVKNLHLEGWHRVAEGPCDLSTDYGIRLAEECGLPEELIADARAMRQAVIDQGANLCSQEIITPGRRAAYSLLQMLVFLKGSPHLEPGSEDTLRQYLDALVRRFPPELVLESLRAPSPMTPPPPSPPPPPSAPPLDGSDGAASSFVEAAAQLVTVEAGAATASEEDAGRNEEAPSSEKGREEDSAAAERPAFDTAVAAAAEADAEEAEEAVPVARAGPVEAAQKAVPTALLAVAAAAAATPALPSNSWRDAADAMMTPPRLASQERRDAPRAAAETAAAPASPAPASAENGCAIGEAVGGSDGGVDGKEAEVPAALRGFQVGEAPSLRSPSGECAGGTIGRSRLGGSSVWGLRKRQRHEEGTLGGASTGLSGAGDRVDDGMEEATAAYTAPGGLDGFEL